MPRPKLLVIAPSCPVLPLRGYEKFLRQHLNDLVLFYDVDLVTLAPATGRVLHHPDGIVSQTIVKASVFSSLLGLLSCLIKILPIQCAQFCTSEFKRTIKNMAASLNYDRVLCYMARTFPVVPEELRNRTVVFGIDPLSISYSLSSRASKFPLNLAYIVEGYLIKRLESRILQSARNFALISKRDIRKFSRLFHSLNQISLIRYGVAPAESSVPNSRRDPGLLIVSGSGFYAPNVRALLYLLEHVWPEVQKVGGFRLQIIGAEIDPQVQNIARAYPDVEILGFVDSVSEHLLKAFACFCLVDLDVGIQTKLLEAMSCGTPAICSWSSAIGIGASHGKELLVARSPAEIVEILKLLREFPDMWRSISESSQAFIEQEFQWAYSSQDLLKILKS